MYRWILIMVFFLQLNCKSEKAEIDQPSFDIPTSGIDVEVMEVTDETFYREVLSNGKLEAKSKSELRFEVGRPIKKISVTNGSYVKEGDVLAVLDNRHLSVQYEKAIIELEEADQRLLEEKIKFGVSNEPDSSISSNILNTLHRNSGFRQAKNNLTLAKALLDQTFLRAPFSGKVANLNYKEGEFSNSGEEFCTIIAEELEVVFQLMEKDISSVHLGQEIFVTPFSVDTLVIKGAITEINPTVSTNGLVLIKASMDESNTSLLDGMNVRVQIIDPIEAKASVPKSALVKRSGRDVIFTYQSGRAQWNYVEILAENTSQLGIKNGIKPGDTIIISGNLNLAQNAQVNPVFVQ